MKRIPYILLGSLTIASATLCADDDFDVNPQNVGSEQMLGEQNQDDDKAFRISARGDWIQEAKINKKEKNYFGHLKFYEAEAEIAGVVYYNKCYEEGLALGLSYNIVHFDWDKNPFFDKEEFPQVSFSVTGFTKRACGWLWQAQASLNWQIQKHNDFSDYTNYDLLLWGRYEYCPDKLFFHVGFLAETGMSIDKIWPVVGFDWVINEKWKLNAIFPLNMAIIYSLNDCWSISLAGRFWQVRRRVGECEDLSKGLFQYRNAGAEFGFNYETGSWKANAHVGYAFGGVITIANKNNKHKKHIDFDSSGYAGGEIAFKF